MKILITGATGLIGRALTKKLLSKGHSVHYLTTSEQEKAKVPGAKAFFWNPYKEVMDDAALNEVDAIVHLAGANLNHRWSSSYKRKILESRVLTANFLFQRLQQVPNQVKSFVTASGVAVYPDSRTEIFTESETREDPSFLGKIVNKWESAADRFETIGLKVAKIRTGPVLAREGGMLKELKAPVKFGFGSALGDGGQWQSWIHIDDLVGIYVLVIERQLEGIFNGTAPIAVTNAALMEAIVKKSGSFTLIKKVPKALLKLALGEMHQMLLSSQHAIPDRTQKQGYIFRFPELASALDDLMT